MIRESIIRYPGSKFLAIRHILPLVPRGARLCSPFMGGGSIELAAARRGRTVLAFDISEPLTNFWRHAIDDPARLAGHAREHYPMTREKYGALKAAYAALPPDRQAAAFFALNRSSMYGLTFTSYGAASKGGEGNSFSPYTLRILREFRPGNLTVRCADFRNVIPVQDPSTYIYCDPPYFLSAGDYYSDTGKNMKTSFDHRALARLLHERGRWLLSYNDCLEAQNLYGDCRIIRPQWAYMMGSSGNRGRGTSRELLIASNDMQIPEQAVLG